MLRCLSVPCVLNYLRLETGVCELYVVDLDVGLNERGRIRDGVFFGRPVGCRIAVILGLCSTPAWVSFSG